MSINSLPPELLREIVEATIPHSDRSTIYSGRQRTLCNLCLVSSRFRQIAQPLLFGIVLIRSEKGFEKLHRSLSATICTDADVKTLICRSWPAPGDWLNIGAFDKLSALCPAVSALTVHVYGASQLSLEPLSSFRHLSDLDLRGLSFPLTTSLPSLRSLTLTGFQAISAILSESESVVPPSLRYLALTDVDNAFRENPVSDKSLFVRLLPQLEAWSIEVDGLEDAYASGGYSILHPFLSRALVDQPLYSESLELVSSNVFKDIQHLRHLHRICKDAFEILLSLITSILASPSHSETLRTIYLNRVPMNWPKVSLSYEGPLQEVEKACNAKGITLVFEEQPDDVFDDPVVSQEFWRRMKRQGKSS
ncbi:hypothetical protein JCM16303_003641 [Sporobolomyces ruberrimus]